MNAEYIKNLFNIHQHCRVGTGKFVAGLGLAGYGLATNNNDFINANISNGQDLLIFENNLSFEQTDFKNQFFKNHST